MEDDLTAVLRKVDLMIAEMADLASAGPHLRILHRFRRSGTICASGEEVVAISLIHRSQSFPLTLSIRLRILLDYLARHKHSWQGISQIAAGISCDPFCLKHGVNSRTRYLVKTVSRAAVKQQIMRLRQALSKAMSEAHLPIASQSVLESQPTVTNEIQFRLSASVSWQHSER